AMVHDGGRGFHGIVADRASSDDPLGGVFQSAARTGELSADGLCRACAGRPVLDPGKLAGRNSRSRAGIEAAGRSTAALPLSALRAWALGPVRVPGRVRTSHGIVMGDVFRRLE